MNPMHRLFVAVRLPAPIRSQLLDLMGGVPGARWQTEDQLHLTLRFIGEVDAHVADDVAGALLGVTHPRFTIALQGAGHFGQGSRAGALWIGVAPADPLAALHKKVDAACRRAGLAPEGRAFLPHITVARLGRAAGPVGSFLSVASATRSEPFTVDSIALYESTLGTGGASYELVERYRLG